jgi:SOS-response transcriptional repressor LexA
VNDQKGAGNSTASDYSPGYLTQAIVGLGLYNPDLNLGTLFILDSNAKVVNTLVAEKQIEKDPKGRIKIINVPGEESAGAPMMLPLFGTIAAGFAAPVEEHAEEQITIDNYLVRNRSSTFLLRVKGDSMIDAGIHEGDLVVVDRSKQPKPEDIVVGVLDGEFTL